MPIYEYQCQKCQEHYEKLQKISEPVLIICPYCGQDGLKRLISAAGFQLKGSGWYVTDFRDKKPGQAKSSDTKPTENVEKKSTASTTVKKE